MGWPQPLNYLISSPTDLILVSLGGALLEGPDRDLAIAWEQLSVTMQLMQGGFRSHWLIARFCSGAHAYSVSEHDLHEEKSGKGHTSGSEP